MVISVDDKIDFGQSKLISAICKKVLSISSQIVLNWNNTSWFQMLLNGHCRCQINHTSFWIGDFNNFITVKINPSTSWEE